MSYNILLCGVGGQGTVLASKLLAATAGDAGLTVHSAETIGMAQRGGPVTSHVRIGEDAYSPLIPKGKADLIIAFEPAEAVRSLDYLKTGGAVIVNEICIKPVTESLHPTGYDGSEMIAYLKKSMPRLITVNADELCKPLGSTKFFNVAVLGVAQGAGLLDFSKEEVLETIEKTVKKDFTEINKKAFLHGSETGAKESGIGDFPTNVKKEAVSEKDGGEGVAEKKAESEEKKPAVARKLTEEEAKHLQAIRKEMKDKKK
ncbi:MAG: indolepyruvate oxidoreductase subunit beta [Lachnospiraceae bacterium]|nr:indolepyruvate oxidoreductase subunit beta [Lachnospiraceae bacterium]